MKPTPDADPVTVAAARVRAELLREHGTTPEVRVLCDMAAAFWRRAEQARALVEVEGLTITNAKGTFTHPLVTVEKNSRLGFLTAVRALRQRPKRTKIGAPTYAERLVARGGALSPAFDQFIDPPLRRRAAKAAKYLSPA
jgi:hypothetical protein